jgi:hypothetical protein
MKKIKISKSTTKKMYTILNHQPLSGFLCPQTLTKGVKFQSLLFWEGEIVKGSWIQMDMEPLKK